MQLAADFFSNTLFFRSTNNNGATAWSQILHSGNYNNYSPTLTGGGASGTWGINVSGNAATATTATNASQLGGIAASSYVTSGSSPTFAGITSRTINLNRSAGGATGIKYYSSGFKAWQDYMAPVGGGQGVDGDLTAPSGTHVTSWGLRSFIENTAGYGWTWESGVSASTAPSIIAELSSVNGDFRTIGQMTATQFNGALNGNAATATSASQLGGIAASSYVTSGSNPTFAETYNNGWFRNNNGLTGLYNQANGNHIYSEEPGFWTMTSAGNLT